MPKQDQSRDGMPRKDQDRRSPGSGRSTADGQASARGSSGSPSSQDYAGDGPGKIGVTSDNQPDLVAPSGVNERDTGAAEDRASAGGTLDFDDGTDMARPRGKVTSTGRAWDDKKPSDAGELGAPSAGMSDRNGPSDPDAKRSR